ncbi:reverse transcriptase domain-containing protein [Tanacetum coccineum]|uniref:Reverse transcriptase domain-containing protein n=1 Tax=Tanacetum coccineum TaxID=301880 RepID=A0ABQ4XLF6_9ASTR
MSLVLKAQVATFDERRYGSRKEAIFYPVNGLPRSQLLFTSRRSTISRDSSQNKDFINLDLIQRERALRTWRNFRDNLSVDNLPNPRNETDFCWDIQGSSSSMTDSTCYDPRGYRLRLIVIPNGMTVTPSAPYRVQNAGLRPNTHSHRNLPSLDKEQGCSHDGGNGGNGGNGNGNGNGGEYDYNFRGFMPARECTYQNFLKWQPFNFNRTEGVLLNISMNNVDTPDKLNDRVNNVARAYTAGNNEKTGYVGSLPYCSKCKIHHTGPSTVRCGNCKIVGHMTRDCKVTVTPNTQRAPVGNQHGIVCYECGRPGHFRKDYPKLRNQNRENKTRNKNGNKTKNQIGGNEATARAYTIGE